MVKYYDVFVPGGFPGHTYNPRVKLRLEERLREVNRNLCKLVTLTGQTKSGKTVLTRRVFPPEETIWIDGGAVTSEDEFWQFIVQGLSLFQSISRDEGKSTKTSSHGKATAGANFLVAKGEGEVGTAIENERTAGSSVTRTVSARVAALNGLREKKRSLVIDDFHYIPRETQGGIIRALKPLIFDGLPVVIVAIPHRRYDALKVEKEMTGRIVNIEIPVWSSEELGYIPDNGFSVLNYNVSEHVVRRLASEAIGSPHLIQDFCRTISKALNLSYAATPMSLTVDDGQLEAAFREVAETIGRPIFEKLARGPQSRTARMQREMIGGEHGDIYQLVLGALAHMRPGLVSIDYEELRVALRDISMGQVPRLQEVGRVLKHMATIAASDQSSTPVIDLDEDEKKLHVTDPFFAFYLRWGELAKARN